MHAARRAPAADQVVTGLFARPATAPGPICGRDAELERVRAAIGGGAGIVITGPLGVGKTRLAQAAVSDLGRRVVHFVGTPAAQAIPLAPVLDLLADVNVPTEQGIREVRARLGGRRPQPVVFVDDAQWLDPASQTLLHLLVRAGEARVVATVRDDTEVPPTVRDLWKDGHLDQLALGPLGPVDAARLMAGVLGAPVEAGAAADLYRRSGGMPLALRELLAAAVAAGALAVRDGLAQVVGELPDSPRLRDVVVSSIARLAPGQRGVLDAVAVAEPIPLRLLRRLCDAAELRTAERDGVIRLCGSRLDGTDRHVAVVGHPLYREAALAAMTPLDRQLLLESLIDAAQGAPDGSEGLALRVASWSIEVGRPAPVDDLISAVRLTHRALDADQAQRVARQLWRQRPDAETGLLYATALAGQLEYGSSYEVLTTLDKFDLTEAQRVSRAALANEALVRLGRHDEAIALLAVAESTVESGPARAHLAAKRAFTASVAGRTRDGLAVMLPLVHSGDPVEFAEAIGAVPCMLALDGRAEDGLDLLDRAERSGGRGDLGGPGELGGYLPLPRRALAVQRGLCLMYAGRLAEAVECAEEGLRAAEEYGSAYLMAGWLNMLGRIELEQGRAAAAVHPLGRVIAETPEASGGAQRALAYNALIEAYALLGQHQAARASLASLLDRPGNVLWYPRGLAELAQGHLCYAEGDTAKAREIFHEGYERAAAQSATIALVAAHTIGRFGDPRLGLDLARRLPPVQGPLAELRLAHLAALVDRDAPALLEVAGRLQHLGAYLYAAEAYGAATRLATRLGETRLAASARRLGGLSRQRVQAVTPELTALSTTPDAAGLTAREREIAMLAARGMPSRAIAARLTLSVRTIDNHLQRIYAKLGVGGRQDLSRAIGTAS